MSCLGGKTRKSISILIVSVREGNIGLLLIWERRSLIALVRHQGNGKKMQQCRKNVGKPMSKPICSSDWFDYWSPETIGRFARREERRRRRKIRRRRRSFLSPSLLRRSKFDSTCMIHRARDRLIISANTSQLMDIRRLERTDANAMFTESSCCCCSS